MKKDANAAFIMDELSTPLVRYLSRKVPSEDANDLAQEALLRMHKFQQGKHLENARAFLFRTANNLVIDQIRRNQVRDRFFNAESRPEPGTEDGNHCAPSAERTVCAEEELDRIAGIIDAMPEKVRQAFLLHRSSELSYSEIARDMGVSVSMVEKYIVRALRLIRESLA